MRREGAGSGGWEEGRTRGRWGGPGCSVAKTGLWTFGGVFKDNPPNPTPHGTIDGGKEGSPRTS